jgi:hypothetical protein
MQATPDFAKLHVEGHRSSPVTIFTGYIDLLSYESMLIYAGQFSSAKILF